MKLMKSLGVEGRSVGVRAGICACVFVCVCVWSGVEVTLETYHDKEGIDQGEPNDDKCHSSWDKQPQATVMGFGTISQRVLKAALKWECKSYVAFIISIGMTSIDAV